jgi:hypothetical protein
MNKNISTVKKMWLGLAVLALASPIGLILPEKFNAGAAWGEWGTDEIEKMLGYVPHGMKKLNDLWQAPMPDYAFNGWDRLGHGMQGTAYVVSALVGVAVIAAFIMLIGKIVTKD